jgi:hypothetical protein
MVLTKNENRKTKRVTRATVVLVGGVAAVLAAPFDFAQGRQSGPPIDRRALVTRHNPIVRAADRLSPLSIGNGEFAFTADVTGLQTFADFYQRDDAPAGGSTPLATQAQWGWHSFPNPEGYRPEDAYAPYDAHGRSVAYASRQATPAGVWLRENPHRLNLAQIGFVLRNADGSEALLADLHETEQTLDLWTGTLTSRFELGGRAVRVLSWVHPEHDLLAVRVDAEGLAPNQLAVRIAFPYARALHSGDPSDWTKPDRHRTAIVRQERGQIEWRRRTLDTDEYSVRLAWSRSGNIRSAGPHESLLSFDRIDAPLEFVASFSGQPQVTRLPDVAATRAASSAHWQRFWQSGGAIDLSESTDLRARELERRIVLSQFLTAIQSSGSIPPQETGLTYNSWFGKFHLEMHWWHAAHFALWNRLEMLERSQPWYRRILPSARETARRQGYSGARWPKMVDPDGRDSPSGVGVFLIWQQPHPIYLAELAYRQRQDRRTLELYRELVFETAQFMASYAVRKPGEQRYVLGPPLIPAQESNPPRPTFNPGFELAYWAFGLETAQRWRERLGFPRDADWENVLTNLSPLPSRDGLYVNTESAPDTFTNADQRRDHPTLLASCGMLPCARADREMMRRTLREVMQSWNFDRTWGWDYPLIAMTAAGWDGAPDAHAPGFPRDGRWVVRWEGLQRLP